MIEMTPEVTVQKFNIFGCCTKVLLYRDWQMNFKNVAFMKTQDFLLYDLFMKKLELDRERKGAHL